MEHDLRSKALHVVTYEKTTSSVDALLDVLQIPRSRVPPTTANANPALTPELAAILRGIKALVGKSPELPQVVERFHRHYGSSFVDTHSGDAVPEESRVAELSGDSRIPTSERAGAFGYSVQVAVRDLEAARTLSDQLNRAGYSVYLTTATVKQVRFHRVRVGPFQTRQAAQQVAKRLETEGYQVPWITK
jgi:hypothetical protein